MSSNRELLAESLELLVDLGRRYWRLSGADSAEDLAHDVAVEVLRGGRVFDAAKCEWAVWLSLTTRRVALTMRQKRSSASRRPVFGVQFNDEVGFTAESVADHRGEVPEDAGRADKLARVRRGVDRLPPRRRRAIRRRFGLDGSHCERSYAEIDRTVRMDTNREAVKLGLAAVRVMCGAQS